MRVLVLAAPRLSSTGFLLVLILAASRDGPRPQRDGKLQGIGRHDCQPCRHILRRVHEDASVARHLVRFFFLFFSAPFADRFFLFFSSCSCRPCRVAHSPHVSPSPRVPLHHVPLSCRVPPSLRAAPCHTSVVSPHRYAPSLHQASVTKMQHHSLCTAAPVNAVLCYYVL